MKQESSANVRSVVRAVAYPPGTKKNSRPYGMPPFAQSLSDLEVAAMATYIRTAWGNRGAPVTPRDADALRAATLD